MKHFLFFTGHSGGNELQLLGTGRNPVPTCKVFVRRVFVLSLALCRVFKSIEPLSFDSLSTRTARSSHSGTEAPEKLCKVQQCMEGLVKLLLKKQRGIKERNV